MVLYRLPMDNVVNCVLQNSSRLNFLEHYNQMGFVFAPFDLENSNPLLIQNDRSFEYLPQAPQSQGNKKGLEALEDKEYHIELVKSAIAEIKKGSLKKVIASRSIDVISKANPLELFHRLLAKYPNAFCYYLFHPNIGTWLGASPELLISVEGFDFKTTSLAGTMAVTKNEAPKWTLKELEEQQMVTRFIENEFRSLNIPLIITKPENQKAGKLWHLKSILNGKLDSFEQLKEVVKALHPTPAVCGLPKKKAKEFILSEENYDRSFYTGFLGELNLAKNNTANFFVNLRCMQMVNGIAKIYVGGGITVDSNAQSELKETIAKSRTMLDLL